MDTNQFDTHNPPTKEQLYEALKERKGKRMDSVDVCLLFPKVRADITLRLLRELIHQDHTVRHTIEGIRHNYEVVV